MGVVIGPRELPEALRRLGSERGVREGRAFFYQDDPPAAALYLVAGSVRPVQFSPDGRPFDLPPRLPGRWLCLAETLNDWPCLFDAVAREACVALAFSRLNLERAALEAPLSRYLLAALGDELVQTHRLLADDDALGKILALLLSRRTAAGFERSRLAMTQAEIAEAVGLTRETVNRQLRALESAGFVETGRGSVSVPDWDRLAVYAGTRSC